ncbi:MAG: recombination regulator RecX [Firmicutes bacterium]|nr:recombination regulator RecX [Bacillota bacterium]
MSYSDISKKTLNYEETKEKALRLLEFRAHSERELKDKLKRAGAQSEDIERALDFCREYGFVNDAEYARRKACDLKNLKKYGKRRIAQELYSKGISSEITDAVLAETEDDEEELYALVKKKLGGDFEQKNIDKCIRYFIYRGYGVSEIKKCAERARGEFDEL